MRSLQEFVHNYGDVLRENAKLSPALPTNGTVKPISLSVLRSDAEGRATPTPPPVPSAPREAPPPAEQKEKKFPRTTAACVDVLSMHPAWSGVLAYNDFTQEIVFAMEPPLGTEGCSGKRLLDSDTVRIIVWFEKQFGVSFGKELIRDALQLAARKNSIHPVRAYLEGLKWDGEHRVGTFLKDYFKVESESDDHAGLVSSAGMRWMIQCVARAFEPGCQADSVLILEGEQGIGKSRGLEALAGKDFFCDSPLDLGNKDTYQKIQGVWIYELAELDALIRAEPSETKAFLTSAQDRFRVPYGRVPEDVPRTVVFCGSVNHGNYLKDLTGNRRFWTVRCCGKIDRDGLKAARDQLWAEAVVLYRQGVAWHLTDEEEALMRVEQDARVADDPWEGRIAAWLQDCTLEVKKVWNDDIDGHRNGDAPFVVDRVYDEALRIPIDKQNAGLTRRVADILRRLGYERKRSMVAGERIYRYSKRV